MGGFKGGAGALDRVITIQTRVEPDPVDRQGGPVPDWDTIPGIDVHAAFEPKRSSEFPQSNKRQHESNAMFRIRYFAGLNPAKHRIKFIQDRRANPQVVSYFNILSVTEVTRFKEIHLEVDEIV